jgi:hypothetical protein
MLVNLRQQPVADRPAIGQTPRMYGGRALLLTGLLLQCGVGRAEEPSAISAPSTRQLRGITAEEVSALITKLEVAQQRLKAGEFVAFELLAGSIASYEMSTVSPREAFLQVPFEKVWQVERVPSDNPLWQPYELAYAPDGLGKPYWEIEVVLGANGAIQRVLILYKPPAPF